MDSIRTKISPWNRLTIWTSDHKPLCIGIMSSCFLLGGGLIAGAWLWANEPQKTIAQVVIPSITLDSPEPAPKFYSPLTGVQVDEALTKRWNTAIMIENSPDARPQSGLKDAGVVYEAIAEGGITRFLTIFQEARPGLIGPVRSVRPYYVDWVAPLDAAVAHIGGSKNALDEIRNGTYKDIDQFFNAKAYWRANDRYAPHNVYTNFDKLDELNQAKGYTSSAFRAWPRKNDTPNAKVTAAKIDISVSSAMYNAHYDYDQATNSYLRSHGTGPHEDREGGRITPKVVIAIKVPSEIGFEDGYRLQMDTVGHNTAYIFQDGTVIEGFWRKANRKAPMLFYDKLGREIAFNRGQTWITVVAPEKQVSWQ